MKKNTNCMQTIYACFIGYIVQAIVNNFVPLLFVTFQNNYHITRTNYLFDHTQLYHSAVCRSSIRILHRQDRIPHFYFNCAYPFCGRTDITHRSSGSFFLPLYRTCNRSYHLCDRRWTSRSTGKPDH